MEHETPADIAVQYVEQMLRVERVRHRRYKLRDKPFKSTKECDEYRCQLERKIRSEAAKLGAILKRYKKARKKP